MVKLKLYYPSFVDCEIGPEVIDFETISDLEKDSAVKARMMPNGNLIQLYAHNSLSPDTCSLLEQPSKCLFQKMGNGGYLCACIIEGTKEKIEKAIKILNVKVANW